MMTEGHLHTLRKDADSGLEMTCPVMESITRIISAPFLGDQLSGCSGVIDIRRADA
jgi:hypothetical protein